MPSLSFNQRFADRVERGEKTHSIRPVRKQPAQWMPGRRVHLFTAMRTRHCRRLGCGEIIGLYDISISDFGFEVLGYGDAIVDTASLDAFARQDGFDNWQDFRSYFRDQYGLPWSGTLIVWKLVPRGEYP